ncbi:RloA protein [Rodentibacter genomosp. 1]|uniref:RloA protein n=1 Tax=Rodentibacter genomosp. 1 TaxID=1908264 RepID=A0A1V3J0D7_9PAST|nr:ATP-binding protein [Rodentibacter genomosp. 1]OOF48392.1 RloA protein [Rodentibacter genomosp. 1]
MLVDFNVKNFRSFNERQDFSLIKSKSDENLNNSFNINENSNFSLLKTAAIYGANASGKSNFLKALSTMKRMVTGNYQRGDKLPVVPFKLNSSTINQPTEFEITFIVDNVRYQYGFSASSTQIYDEWLFAYPKNHAQKWFERIWNEENKSHDWKFSSFLLGSKQIWLQSTRENALFLATAVQLNSEQLKPIFDWFNDTLHFANSDGFAPIFTANLCEDDRKRDVLKFLKMADFHISDIKVEATEFNIAELPADMPEPLKDFLSQNLKGEKKLQLETIHVDNNGKPVPFNFHDESDGTQKFFAFAGPILDVLKNGYVLCIDELNVNLHPKLVQFLVELFHSKESNTKNAQLIFTTHETSILTQDVFRRDQIWFCERSKEQSSVLYPLSDFSPKKGKENLELGYLSGRYGALPFISTFFGVQ